MGDATYSIRINQQTKDLLQKLQQESGETQAEFFRVVASQLELDQLKQENQSGKEIEELQMHSARINEIMVSIINRSNSVKSMCDQQLNDLKDEFYAKFELQDKEVSDLVDAKNDIEKAYRLNSDRLFDLEVQLQETKKALSQAGDLNSEYKIKISDLSDLVSEYKEKAEAHDALLIKCSGFEKDLEINEISLAEAEMRIHELKEQLTNINEAFEKSQKLAHEFQIKYEQSEINLKNSLREAAASTREEVAKVKEEYLVKVQNNMTEIDQLRKELAEAIAVNKTFIDAATAPD